MLHHQYYRFGWLISIGLFASCGPVSDPDADRRTIEKFAADPAKNDPKTAKAAADRISQSVENAGTPRDRLILAGFYDAIGDSTQALQHLSQIPNDLPDPKTSAAARLSEGRIAFYRTRQARRAETALKSAIRLDPGSHLAWLPLADLYDIQNRRVERNACYARLDQASALDRNRLLNWTCDRKLDSETAEQAQVLKALVAADPYDADSAIALADHDIQSGDFAAAESAINAILAENQPAALARITLRRARIAAEQGNADQASAILKTVDPTSIDPRNAALHCRLQGRLAMQYRKAAEAETALRKALAADPDDREAHQLLVQALKIEGKAKESEETTRRLASIDRLEDLGQKVRASLRRDDPQTLRQLADTAIELGRYDLAKAWLRQMLANDPLNATIQQEIYRIDQQAKASGQAGAISP